MRTAKEIQKEIRDLKAQMKRDGMRVTSFMNRQDVSQARCNEKLFALKLELDQSRKATA